MPRASTVAGTGTSHAAGAWRLRPQASLRRLPALGTRTGRTPGRAGGLRGPQTLPPRVDAPGLPCQGDVPVAPGTVAGALDNPPGCWYTLLSTDLSVRLM